VLVADGTLLLAQAEIDRLLTPDACIEAVEDAFARHARGQVPAPGILGMHAEQGGFHVKAALLATDKPYFAAKLNANFPQNAARHGLPTIQGVVVLSDASNGEPLALLDSVSITALRTAAATAVAAKYLARESCRRMLICGCGAQAPAQLRALLRVRMPERVYAFDSDRAKAERFASAMAAELAVEVVAVPDLSQSAACDVIVTCTSSHRAFLDAGMVGPGAFVAAVGADNEDKHEIAPALMARSSVVTDLTAQASQIGDLHHAIAAGAMGVQDVHAELGEVIGGKKAGRRSDDQVFVFDSTGTGLQDVAAAIAAYRRAVATGAGMRFRFSSGLTQGGSTP
jgi:alanine dehydrogenase